jgi:hypothetical protein
VLNVLGTFLCYNNQNRNIVFNGQTIPLPFSNAYYIIIQNGFLSEDISIAKKESKEQRAFIVRQIQEG